MRKIFGLSSIVIILSVIHNVYSSCPHNEIFSECGNGCEFDCFYGDIKMCVLDCGEASCVCKKNFYRSVTGACVSYERCTKSKADIKYCIDQAGVNAMISSVPNCPSQICGRRPKRNCGNLPGCICKRGFHLNKTDHCVRPAHC